MTFDPERLPAIRSLVRQRTEEDRGLLTSILEEVNQLKVNTVTIQPRNTNSISLVAADGGNNRLQFNPYLLQVVRIVDSNGAERFLDVISPTTDPSVIDEHNFANDTPLARLLTDLGLSSVRQLSTMVPQGTPRGSGWTLVYRDLCEWAVLYELICYRDWGSSTLIVHDGLLRTKIFAGDLFVQMYAKIRDAIERVRNKTRVDIFLVGIAKHSEVLSRYRMAMALAEVFPAGASLYTKVPIELQEKVYTWPEYTRLPDETNPDVEAPKFNMGSMYLVRFGTRTGDPVWTVDLLASQDSRAQEVFGSLVSDAQLGFPVAFYPHCLQEADRYAQVVDLDLAILQDTLVEAVREQVAPDRRGTFDAVQLETIDPAAKRYA
ncbi:MAG: hypothetical protein QOK28_2296 [Actinomycetota bacterium]|jgi:hypothetical protein